MEDVLAIFPSRGLDNSMLVPIFIGLVYHALCIEALGWSFAGLVVSGYLAAVFVIAPEAGVVICGEIITTYFIVYIVSEHLAKFGWWHSFFGRDRFLAFFIISLLVRLVYEVWLFQNIAGFASQFLGIPLEATTHLYGIGLVIVPLTAHAMWRPGFIRGGVQVGVPVLLTYLTLVFVLIPYTNFSIANFELTFQDLALDFASSPKIYITLILGMLIAARLNIRLGWDFNGIMIPSLLAVAWYMPWKILATMTEATIIVIIAWLISMLPIFRKSNLEGIRRLMLIFTIGMAIKYLIGFYFAETNPGFQVSDLFGFGYLLPSLIALNIWEHRSWPLVVGPTLITSFLAFVGSNIIGLGLFQIDKIFVEEMADAAPGHSINVRVPLVDIKSLHLSNIQTTPVVPEDFIPTTPATRIRYKRILSTIRNLAETSETSEGPKWITGDFANDLERLHLTLSRMKIPGTKNKHLLVLREPVEDEIGNIKGWGTIGFVPQCIDGSLMEVPYPFEEPDSLDASVKLIHTLQACTVLINGWRSFRPDELAALRRSSSPFALAHNTLLQESVVQVRQWTGPTTLFVKTRIPASFRLDLFKEKFPDYEMKWKSYDKKSPSGKVGIEDFVEILLNENDIDKLFKIDVDKFYRKGISGLAYLQELLIENENLIAQNHSYSYVPPTPLEAEFMTQAIVRPIRRLLEEYEDSPQKLISKLGLFNGRASVFGYEIKAFESKPNGKLDILLQEKMPNKRWGFYLFRSKSDPWVIEVPRPLTDFATLPIGINLYGRLNASALFIAGAAPNTLDTLEADITRLDNIVNPFLAAHRGLYTRLTGSNVPWVVQVRGLGQTYELDSDILISTAVDLADESPRLPMVAALQNDSTKQKIKWELYSGQESQMGLKAIDNLLLRFSSSLIPQSSALYWVSTSYRRQVPSIDTWKKQQLGLKAFNIKGRDGFIENEIKEKSLLTENKDWDLARKWLEQFSMTRNVNFLKAAYKKARRQGFNLEFLYDMESAKSFALLKNKSTSATCLIKASEKGTEKLDLSDDPESMLRSLRYGNGLSLCNTEVKP